MNNSTFVHDISQTECSSSVSIAFTVVLSSVSFVALTGNFLVLVAFIKTPSLRTSPNYYIVNMAVSDIVGVILNWPLFAIEGMLQAGENLITDPAVASLFCKLGIYSRAVSYVVSILSLVLIAVDRFIATAFPLKSLKITAKTRAIFLLLSWCLPALCLIPYFVYSEIVQVDKHTFCRDMMSSLAKNIYHLVSFALVYLAPLVSILVLYSLVIKNSRRIADQLDNGQRSRVFRKTRVIQNQNIMKIFGSIVLAFFTCWTPLYVYFFLKSQFPSMFIKDKCIFLVGLFYYIFPLLSTAINPFILITFSSGYRSAIEGLFCSHFQHVAIALVVRHEVLLNTDKISNFQN